MRNAASVVAKGTSSCVSSTRLRANVSALAATSSALSSPFAPGTIVMQFWPALSTRMEATPLAAMDVVVTFEVSTP